MSMTWDEIYKAAEDCGFGDPNLKRKDNARGHVRNLMLELGYDDPDEDEIPEDSIEAFINEKMITFDESGNIISISPHVYDEILGSPEKVKMLLNMMARNIPDEPGLFNDTTSMGEPQHWIDLPYGRSLEITYEETGDNNRYYSWRVHCNDNEYDNDDFHGTMGIMDQSTSDDLSFVTRRNLIAWAFEVAMEKSNATNEETSCIFKLFTQLTINGNRLGKSVICEDYKSLAAAKKVAFELLVADGFAGTIVIRKYDGKRNIICGASSSDTGKTVWEISSCRVTEI